MPCTYPPEILLEEANRRIFELEHSNNGNLVKNNEEINKLIVERQIFKEKLDEVTNLLCYVEKYLPRNSQAYKDEFGEKLKEWFKIHKEFDNGR